MKRNFRKLFISGSLTLFVGLAIVGCKKDENNDVAPNGKATISGYLQADLDLTNGDLEPAANIKVQAIINSRDLVANPDNNKNYPDIIYNTTTDATGKYTFTVDANNEPVEVQIKPQDFQATQKIGTNQTQEVYFTISPFYSDDVVSGQEELVPTRNYGYSTIK